MEVDIYVNKTVEQNAELYYEKAKKAKKKLKGAVETVEKFQRELGRIEDIKVEVHKPKEKRKKLWFEKFRWFLTSQGDLVIGGRDATTNEIIIKKHTDKKDLVFHTDMAGSPFFVIKAPKTGKIDNQSIQETADATCSFSRAWKLNLNTQSVFHVNPDQVSKDANPGEFLPKGAFMIRGRTNYIENKINLAIGKIKSGEYKDLAMCAPLESVEKHCDPFYKLQQGNGKPSDIAKKLRKELNADIDEIIRILPSGGVDLVKERKRKNP